jgi:hypothetical protein
MFYHVIILTKLNVSLVAWQATFGGYSMLNEKILKEIEEYIQSHFILELQSVSENISYKGLEENIAQSEIHQFIEENRKPTLQSLLFRFIDRTGASDPEIYKKAGLDRKLFSKIRSNPNYRPRKQTIIALALALELNINEADELLQAAGYSLSQSQTFDLVIEYCIKNQIYNIHDVNQALQHFQLKPLL